MRILIINPNSDTAMEEKILASGSRVAASGTTVHCQSVADAPPFIEDYLDELLAGPGMVNLLRRTEPEYDAFIVACHSDVNIEVLREQTDKPVVGIGDASMKLATMLGHRFSVIQTTDHSVPMKEDVVRRYGLADHCASVRSVDESSLLPMSEQIAQAARLALSNDGAETLILGCAGCAGCAGLAEKLTAELGVPVLDGVACAVKVAEAFLSCGLTTSKRRKYRPVGE
jgi:allantoin racemase